MPQIYFLSIVFNVLVGFILAFRKEETEGEGFSLNLDSETTRLLIGIFSAFTGFLKLLSPMKNIPIVGDLIPALVGLGGGFILIFNFYRRRSTVDSPTAETISEFIKKYRRLAGFVCLGTAAIHLIFCSVLFL